MNPVYHILNGDALKDRFPASIQGELIVARECLVDGDVQGETLEEFFRNRAHFIVQTYGGYSKKDYERESVTEFDKMMSIQPESTVYFWFEDDLFCQVNFWFTAFLLSKHGHIHSAKLVRPEIHDHYGFGGLSSDKLVDLYHKPVTLNELGSIAQLWLHYQSGDTAQLLKTAQSLAGRYPFILPAVKAHLERLPTKSSPGRPKQSLTDIMSELNTTNFGKVFQEFNKRESIYGFGDLQVKRMYDEIVKSEE